MFGDSMVRNMTSDIGLVTTSFENQWELRFKRGTKMTEVLNMIDANREDIKWGDDVVVVGGTNDMMNLGMYNPQKNGED